MSVIDCSSDRVSTAEAAQVAGVTAPNAPFDSAFAQGTDPKTQQTETQSEQHQQQQQEQVVFSKSPRPVQSLKHTFDRTRNNHIQILTPELRDWVLQCSDAVAEMTTASPEVAVTEQEVTTVVSQVPTTPDKTPTELLGVSNTPSHAREQENSSSCTHKAAARVSTCIIHIVKVINDAACAVEVDSSIATMTDCILMLNDVVCVSEQSKLWEDRLPPQLAAETGKFKTSLRDRLRNLRHALTSLQARIEILFAAIVRQRALAVCRAHVNIRTYRVGVNESYTASVLPEALEVNILRPVGDTLRVVLPMMASKLLSMALNEVLNSILDYLLTERIMFNFSGVHRLYKDMEAIKAWVIRTKQLWACPAGKELLEDKSGWVRVNSALQVLAGEEHQAPARRHSSSDPSRRDSRSSSRDTSRHSDSSTASFVWRESSVGERNQWVSLRRSSWTQSLQFWKSSSNFRPRRNAGIVPSIQLDYSEL